MGIQGLPERLVKIRSEHGYTRKSLSQKLGIPYRTLTNYENGEREPGHTYIVTIANLFGVSTDYILGVSDNPQQAESKNAPSDVSEEAKKLAVDYDEHLDTWGQKAVRGLADTEMARTAAERTAQDPTPAPTEKPARAITALPRAKRRSDGFAEIKVYEQPAAAGLGNYLDEPPFHMEQYPEDVVPEKADFGIVISGDSMEPEIHNGGTVFVQSAPSIDAGEIGIFVLDGKAYCKMLAVDHEQRQVRLISVNKTYEDIPISDSDDFYTLGRVLGQWTPGVDRYEP